jgi:DNA-directed RNA polymerase specialized sigma24 family protein
MRAIDQALPPFQSFLEEHHEPVRRFLTGMVGPVEADDCLQETFLAALSTSSRVPASTPGVRGPGWA